MVVGAFPLIKLGGLLLRQISKPIANMVKEKAKNNTVFRTYICMPPAQLYNWCEIQTKMWILNLGKPVNIPVLSEAMAIELGANLLGEGIVFCIAAGLLIAEYNRSTKKEEAKETDRKQETAELLLKIQELYFRVEQQDTQIRELTRHVVNIDKIGIASLFRKSPTPELSPPPPAEPVKKRDVLKPEEVKPSKSVERFVLTRDSTSPSKNFILKAAEEIQDDLTGNNKDYRQSSIIYSALSYIQNDVYRRPITVAVK